MQHQGPKKHIERVLQSQHNTLVKAVYPIQFPEIEDHLFRFVYIARSAKLHLSIATLQTKAHNISDNLVNVVKEEQKRKIICLFQASGNWGSRVYEKTFDAKYPLARGSRKCAC